MLVWLGKDGANIASVISGWSRYVSFGKALVIYILKACTSPEGLFSGWLCRCRSCVIVTHSKTPDLFWVRPSLELFCSQKLRKRQDSRENTMVIITTKPA